MKPLQATGRGNRAVENPPSQKEENKNRKGGLPGGKKHSLKGDERKTSRNDGKKERRGNLKGQPDERKCITPAESFPQSGSEGQKGTWGERTNRQGE